MADTAPAPSPVFVLHNTIGAYFVADMLCAVLLGGLGVQTFIYYNNFPSDTIANKALVAFIFVLNLLHQIFICVPLYDITITHYADPSFLLVFTWTFVMMSLLNALISYTLQMWYCFRIFRLSGNNFFIVIPLVMIGTAQFVVNMIVCGIASSFHDYTRVHSVEKLITVFNSLSVSEDVLIAIVMSVLLNKSRTGFKRTDNVITRLTMYCANTGLLTGAAAVLTIILLVAYPTTSLNFPPYFALPRLYGISFMAILNARTGLKASMSQGDDVSMSVRSHTLNRTRKELSQGAGNGTGVAINISQTVMHDEASDISTGKKHPDYL